VIWDWIVTRKRQVLVFALLAICAVLGGAATFAYRCLALSLAAEVTHHSYRNTLAAVTAYVDEREQWPNNWDELQPFLKSVDPDPERLTAVPSRVHIDFTLTLKDVAGLDPVTFAAIEPIGPNYGKAEDAISNLLVVVRTRLALKRD
jgi:hypothetical protein